MDATDSLYGSLDGRGAPGARELSPRVLVADMIGDRDSGSAARQLSTDWLTDLLWTPPRGGLRRALLPDTLAVEDDHAPSCARACRRRS